MNIPGFLLRHTVTVEPYLGTGAYGAQYGPSVALKCLRDDDRKLVRSPEGEEVLTRASLYCLPTANVPIHSRVTLQDGQQGTVFATRLFDGGGLATPNHLEVSLK